MIKTERNFKQMINPEGNFLIIKIVHFQNLMLSGAHQIMVLKKNNNQTIMEILQTCKKQIILEVHRVPFNKATFKYIFFELMINF